MTEGGQTPFSGCFEKDKRRDIQSIRLFAAFIIFVWHYWGLPIIGFVSIFFLLSGYLISQGLMRQIDSYAGHIQKKAFVIHVAYRILGPMFVLALALFPLIIMFAPDQVIYEEALRYLISLVGFSNLNLALENNVIFLRYYMPSIGHEWTIGVQLQAYIFMLVIFAIAGFVSVKKNTRRPLLMTVVVTGSLSLMISGYHVLSFYLSDLPNLNVQLHYSNTFSRFYQFMIGALIALIIPEIGSFGKNHHSCIKWVQLLGVTLIPGSFWFKNTFSSPVSPAIPDLMLVSGCGLLICSGIMTKATDSQPNVFGRFLEGRLIGLLGGYTYSLYLVHWPILVLATMYFWPPTWQFG